MAIIASGYRAPESNAQLSAFSSQESVDSPLQTTTQKSTVDDMIATSVAASAAEQNEGQ